jgi:hypothetical protein
METNKLGEINKTACPRCVSVNGDRQFIETLKMLYEQNPKLAYEWLDLQLVNAKTQADNTMLLGYIPKK